ncbi:hypothetical protein ACERII_23520 [Evansella sp. AB-rgal1]|uniref:hypothetical protein n=1 Tax=Evansella sp. AB-rgal1 TaxID=3242696 RepID=UPI00359DAEDB
MTLDLELVRKYSPYLFFDKREPFFPKWIGVTILGNNEESPSFHRKFVFEESVDFVIEYAIYWDFDIQHMYDLEHVWVYVGHSGEVVNCEASFHGRFVRGLLFDQSNLLDSTHVKLYSQPGKHAFLPKEDMFQVIPNVMTCTNEYAGQDGLIVTDPFKGLYETDESTNKRTKEYLKRFRFVPSLEFFQWSIPTEQFMVWSELKDKIVERIETLKKEV